MGDLTLWIDANQDVSGWTNLPTGFSSANTGTRVTISDAQVDDIGGTFITAGDGSRSRVVGNITYFVPAGARQNFTIEVDDVRAGMLYVYDLTGDTVLVSRILTGTETDTTITLSGNTYADSNQFYAFYWPDSTLEIAGDGAAQNVYRPIPVTWMFSDGNQVLSPETIAGVLENSATGILSGQGFTTSNSGSGATCLLYTSPSPRDS